MTNQKHYPMPELSEQEREELISECKTEIEDSERVLMDYHDKVGSYAHESLKRKVMRQKIALAALTAPKPEPVAYIMGQDSISDFNSGYEFFAVRDNEGEDELESIALYTAPPLLADMLPFEWANPILEYPDVERRKGWNACLAEVKRRLTIVEAPKMKPVVLPKGFKPVMSEVNGKPVAVMSCNADKGDWIHQARIKQAIKDAGGEVQE